MDQRSIVGAVLALLVASATPARAQTQPVPGLFGPAANAAQPPKRLDLTASLFGVYDTRPPRLLTYSTGVRTKDALLYSDLQMGLLYTQQGEHTSFAAKGTSTLQDYPQIGNVLRWSGAGSVAATTTRKRSTFSADQQVLYTPFSHFRVIPVPIGSGAGLADVAAPDVALAVSGRESYRYNTGMSWTYRPARRSTLGASYHYEYLDFVPVDQHDWTIQNASLSFTQSLTAKTAFVAGYVYHRRDFQGDAAPLLRHDINVGVNYNNTLPFSPRTTFSFSVGSTGMSRDRTANTVSTDATFFRLTGQADLEHQLSRTWRLGLSYNRAVQYIEGISDVFLAYTATGSIGGYLGPRVDVRATTGYSTGALRFGTRQRGYDTNASTAQLRIAISRSFALQTEYVYYRYLFSDALMLPTGIPVRENRHVIRVGLTTWFPLLR